jgi:hypothetical protein
MSLIRRYPLASFFVLAYALSWWPAILYALDLIPPTGRDITIAPLAPTLNVRYTVDTVNSNYQGGSIYVRRVKSRGSGPYFQLVRSFRNEEGQPRQEVLVHLGVHETPEAALSAWPNEVAHLRRIGRDPQADKLEANLKKLEALTEAEKRKG